MTEDEVRKLIARAEGQYLERKSLWDRENAKCRPQDRRKVRDWIADYCAAFANADGGTLLLGVEDDGTLTGHGFPSPVIEEFLRVPERRLRPELRVDVGRFFLDGHEVIALEVPAAPEAVMVEGNGFPYRTGDSLVREPQEVINQRKQSYRRVGFEQRVRPDASLADLDLPLAKAFLSRSPRSGSDEDLLISYGLIAPKAGGPGITNAALLLFGQQPLTSWHPRAGIRFFRVDGTERRHGRERNVRQLERIEQPLVRALDESRRLLSQQIRRSERLFDLFFREMPEYPDFAWQEALVNAVAHRDYGDQGREIEIWLFEDRLEIKSPGDLVPPVTLKALRERRSVHASRNPLVVRVLADCGIMREEGEGIPRIFDEMRGSLLRPPHFDVEARTFRVVLHNEPVYEGPSQAWKSVLREFALKPSQLRTLMAHPDGFSTSDYRELNGIDRDQAYREIQELVAMEVVLPADGTGRAASYQVAPSLSEQRRWLERRLPGIIQFFREHDSLQNADYRRLFEVSRSVALQELRRLVAAGFLVLEGERRGARYHPGPVLDA